jgi:hypothetical protein
MIWKTIITMAVTCARYMLSVAINPWIICEWTGMYFEWQKHSLAFCQAAPPLHWMHLVQKVLNGRDGLCEGSRTSHRDGALHLNCTNIATRQNVDIVGT